MINKLPLSIRSWDCPSCGTKDIDRDINAGKNILAAGLAVIVCGATVRAEQRRTRLTGFPRQLDMSVKSVKPGARKQKPRS